MINLNHFINDMIHDYFEYCRKLFTYDGEL